MAEEGRDEESAVAAPRRPFELRDACMGLLAVHGYQTTTELIELLGDADRNAVWEALAALRDSGMVHLDTSEHPPAWGLSDLSAFRWLSLEYRLAEALGETEDGYRTVRELSKRAQIRESSLYRALPGLLERGTLERRDQTGFREYGVPGRYRWSGSPLVVEHVQAMRELNPTSREAQNGSGTAVLHGSGETIH